MIYGEKLVFSGPRIVSASSSGSTLTVKCTCWLFAKPMLASTTLRDSDSDLCDLCGLMASISDDPIGTDGEGIKLRGGYGFEVSTTETDATGKVGTWTRVNATAATKDTVTLSGIPGQVKALRYAWEDSPSIFTGTGPAVFNGEGLPATPSLLNITAQ
jgi:hypothetical protein